MTGAVFSNTSVTVTATGCSTLVFPEAFARLENTLKVGIPLFIRGRVSVEDARTVLDWTPQEGQMFYVSYTRGYKSGGFPVILAARQENFEPVTQEKLVAYEIGAKNLLFDGLLRLDTGAFYYDYRDKQLLTFRLDQFFGAAVPILFGGHALVSDGLRVIVAAAWQGR